MPSSYTSNLRLVLPVQGELSGTWGDTVNSGLTNLTDAAIAGQSTVSVTTANQALTIADGSADQARAAILKLTTTTTANFNIYAPPVTKAYVINNTTAYTATIYNSTVAGNTTAAGTGIAIPAGARSTVYSDGTNFLSDTTYIPTVTAATLTTTGNVTLGNDTADTVRIYGYMATGTVPTPDTALFVGNTALTTTAQTGVRSSITSTSAATGGVLTAYEGSITTSAGSYAVDTAYGFHYGGVGLGGTTTLTNNIGVMIEDLSVGTNAYGVRSQVAAGANRWNVYSVGSAQNYFEGNVGVGEDVPTAKLHVYAGGGSGIAIDGAAGENRNLLFKTAGVNRWVLSETSTAESGSNAGSDLALYNYSDAGTLLGTALAVTRATGSVGFGTASPIAKLNTYEVIGGGESKVIFQNFSTTTDTTVGLYLSPTNGTLTTGSIRAGYIKAINTGSGVTALTFGTNASGADPVERMRIDGAGNIGINGAADAWGSAYLAVQTGTNSLISHKTASNIYMVSNAYYNGVNWVYSNAASTASAYVSLVGGVFSVAGAAAGTNPTTFTFTNLLQLSKGNTLALEGATSVAGTGITFPTTASSGTGVVTSNTLDDYEEGTFTPVLSATSSTIATPVTSVGAYTKIGNVVNVTIRLILATAGNTLTANGLTITGLPFTSGNVSNRYFWGTASWANAVTAMISISPYIINNSATVGLYKITAAATSNGTVLNANDLSPTAGSVLSVSISYMV